MKNCGYGKPISVSHYETGVQVIHTLYVKRTQEIAKTIKFYPEDKTVITEYYIRTSSGSWKEASYIPFSMQELKAINAKVQELGWEE